MSFTRNQNIHTIFAGIAKVFAVFALVLLMHTTVEAASLSLSPSGGSYAVGKTISVRVLVGSGGQSINAVDGSISFSNDTLSLVGISKSGIVNLWAQDPTFSNSSGTANFQGVILSGYSGGGGTVVTLTFKAKAVGAATVSISSGGSSVLLNDGNGTNVLSGTSGANFTITQGTTKPSQPVTQPTTQNPPPKEQPTTPVEHPVEPIAPGAAPLFTDYQSPVIPGNFVVVKGTASPKTLVSITFTVISHDGKAVVTQRSVMTTDNGTFDFVSDQKVTEGSRYVLVASTPDGQKTDPLQLSVKNSLGYILAAWLASILAVQMSVALAILILIIVTGYLLYRNHVLKKHLQMAIDEIHTLEQK